MNELILPVHVRSSSELLKHTEGPGTRFVFSDHNNNPNGNIYTILRVVHDVDQPALHVEPHSHEFESLAVFKGFNPDLSGLVVEFLLGETWHRFESPRAVRIPAGLLHNWRYVKGSGEYWNIVLTPGADYNRTLR